MRVVACVNRLSSLDTNMADQDLPIILYHYPYSPYARRVVWYLTLRGIPYSQCVSHHLHVVRSNASGMLKEALRQKQLQPPILPRPDVTLLGIRYRRIPLLSIGRDVYVDTRLIIRKLDALFPPSHKHPGLAAPPGTTQRAVERLLAVLAIDGGLFARATQLIPPGLPLMKDPAFARDRADFRGLPPGTTPPSEEAEAALRAEAVAEIRAAAEFLETTLLADGREWILGGGDGDTGPSLADIEAVWPLHWLRGMPGALPADQVSAAQFPKVFAWIERFEQAVAAARKKGGGRQGKPPTLSGERARSAILNAPFVEAEIGLDAVDAVVRDQGLAKGAAVTVWPLDTGSAHKDSGRLVGMDSGEIVFETEAGVRVHTPRHAFRVRASSEKTAKI